MLDSCNTLTSVSHEISYVIIGCSASHFIIVQYIEISADLNPQNGFAGGARGWTWSLLTLLIARSSSVIRPANTARDHTDKKVVKISIRQRNVNIVVVVDSQSRSQKFTSMGAVSSRFPSFPFPSLLSFLFSHFTPFPPFLPYPHPFLPHSRPQI